MNAWSDLESSLAVVPEFWVDGRDNEPASELQRQVAFRQLCRIHAPAVSLVAIPNGGVRGQKALNQARREGAAWGFPDLIALARGKVAFLEFKNGTAKVPDRQLEWLDRLWRMGFPVGVFRRADSALDFLREHEFPMLAMAA